MILEFKRMLLRDDFRQLVTEGESSLKGGWAGGGM